MGTLCTSGPLYDRSALHHEGHVLQRGDVGERVALHGDEVGELALLDRAQAVSARSSWAASSVAAWIAFIGGMPASTM